MPFRHHYEEEKIFLKLHHVTCPLAVKNKTACILQKEHSFDCDYADLISNWLAEDVTVSKHSTCKLIPAQRYYNW